MSDPGLAAVVVALLLLAAFFAMAETAIARVDLHKARRLAGQKKRSGRALVHIAQDPAPFLNTVLLATLVCHVSGTAIATGLAIRHWGAGGEAIAAALMTFAIFVFAEVVPKTYTVQRTEQAALAMAGPVYLLGRALWPIGKVLIAVANAAMALLPGKGLPRGPFVTEEEIRDLVDVAEQEAEIEAEERRLIHSVFDFGDTVVRQVMVPRPDMVLVSADATLREALDVVLKAGFSRVPVYKEGPDNVIGILYAKDLLRALHEPRAIATTAEIVRPAIFVPEQKKVAELLREMQIGRVHLGIVLDEYGGTVGLVTIEDLLEEIVGEIVDEYDREEPLVEPIDDVTVRVDAKMPVDEVDELLGVHLPRDGWDTIGGLIFGVLGRLPRPGERVDVGPLKMTVEGVAGRRIRKVVIAKL